VRSGPPSSVKDLSTHPRSATAGTAEGRIYALAEIANRRQIYLYSLPEIVKLSKKIGLRVEATATAGLSRGGITVVVSATKPHS
jgi:hypothetical protein